MDEEQTVFEQLTLSDFKKSSSAALKLYCQAWEKIFETKSPLKMLKNAFHLKYSSRSHNI